MKIRQIFTQPATALALYIAISGTPALAFDLVTDGQITVAFTGDMPGSGWQDGKLIGYDGEIMQSVADRLGLSVTPALMEWSGTIASVQAGRVDVMLGTMGWTKQRTELMTLSEPIHYFRNGIMQSADTNWNTLADLEGKRVGSITGFSFVPELRSIDGLELSLYDTSDAAVRDLLAGRIDAVVADPPVISFAIKQNPDWNMKFTAFTDNKPDFPLLTSMGQTVFGFNTEDDDLRQAVDEIVLEMWSTCAMQEIGAKYGLEDNVWFTVSGANQRAGVDRPDNYELPQCDF